MFNNNLTTFLRCDRFNTAVQDCGNGAIGAIVSVSPIIQEYMLLACWLRRPAARRLPIRFRGNTTCLELRGYQYPSFGGLDMCSGEVGQFEVGEQEEVESSLKAQTLRSFSEGHCVLSQQPAGKAQAHSLVEVG
ncbi:hypothetical protein BST61_g3962 [Cercospora zeina]